MQENVNTEREPRIFAYCRVSTNEERQDIDHQIGIIKSAYPDIKDYDIYCDTGSGMTFDEKARSEWNRLIGSSPATLRAGDTIVFSEVSRFSRNADEGYKMFCMLTFRKIKLVFLRDDQRQIDNTAIVDMLNELDKHLNSALQTAQEERELKAKRTAEGVAKAKKEGRRAGAPKGKRQTTKKSLEAMPEIYKYNAETQRRLATIIPSNIGLSAPEGNLSDTKCAKMCGIAKSTVRRYRGQIIKDVTEYITTGTITEWMIGIITPKRG